MDHVAPCVLRFNANHEILGESCDSYACYTQVDSGGVDLKKEYAEAAFQGRVLHFEGGQLNNFMVYRFEI